MRKIKCLFLITSFLTINIYAVKMNVKFDLDGNTVSNINYVHFQPESSASILTKEAPAVSLDVSLDGNLFVNTDGSVGGWTPACFGYVGENSMGSVPIGAVIAWHKGLLSGASTNLPTGWIECNGQMNLIPGSVFGGKATPNLNEEISAGIDGRFLRGTSPGGGGTMQDDATKLPSDACEEAPGHFHSEMRNCSTNAPHTHDVSGDSETRPYNMSVTYYMRVL